MQSHAKLLWCPVDIPKFPYSDFNPSLEVKEFFAWKYKKIIESKRGSSTISEINPIVCKEYPDLIDWINLFPFKTIRKINLHTQIKECQSHLDFGYQQVIKKGYDKKLYNNNFINEPCGYRTLILGSRTNMQYIIYNSEKVYTTMPDDTDTFLLRNTETIHGVDEEPGRTILYMHFEIDTDKNKKLIQSSLEKYSNYAIYGTEEVYNVDIKNWNKSVGLE
jgi:hypothetical protein|tara:strand:- start:1717 stop:2376 length:660 start_codon:yes stop_codon:yes gene_type:complete